MDPRKTPMSRRSFFSYLAVALSGSAVAQSERPGSLLIPRSREPRSSTDLRAFSASAYPTSSKLESR
jgi:hypothetical protein